MNDFEKINTDLATLFREGRALLDAGNSAVMNGCREEAFRKFVDLGLYLSESAALIRQRL